MTRNSMQKKLKTYFSIVEKNKNKSPDDKLPLNAYHSPSPMNELCDYICSWEKHNILWDNCLSDLVDTRCLIVNNDIDLSDKKVIKICRKYINEYAEAMRRHMNLKNEDFDLNSVIDSFKDSLSKELGIDEETIANYVIKTSYNSFSISKSFAWSAYGEYIIENLKNNTNPKKNISIREVPYYTDGAYEYLGKYYEFEVGDSYLQL